MYGSHDTRHTCFPQVGGGQRDPREMGRHSYRAKEQLELVHFDLCGPMTIQAKGSFEYFITFIDDYCNTPKYTLVIFKHNYGIS